MSELMARFGPDSFEAQHLGENNSVMYRLLLRGSNRDSKSEYTLVTINGGDNLLVGKNRGFNVVVLDATGNKVEQRTFDIYAQESHRETFVTYMQSLPADRIACIVSDDAMRSDEALDNYMYKIGSRAWPGLGYLNKSDTSSFRSHRSSYSAIYNSNMKAIVMENFVGNDASQQSDTRSITELVFDTIRDVGATGGPGLLVEDQTEYSCSGDKYNFKQYLTSKVPDNISIGDTFYFEGELWRDATAVTDKAYPVLYMYGYKSDGVWTTSKFVSGINLPANTWQKFSGYYTVQGAETASVGCAVYHYPSAVTTGTVKIRNVLVTEVSRAEDSSKDAGFGVNGIRATHLQDSTPTNPVLQLLNIPVSPNNKVISSSNFKETQA